MAKKDQDLNEILTTLLALPAGDLSMYGIDPSGGLPVDITKLELIAMKLIERACIGDKEAAKEVFDRLLGKPMQHQTKQIKVETYQDFLLQIVHKEQLEKKPVNEILEVKNLESNKQNSIVEDLLG